MNGVEVAKNITPELANEQRKQYNKFDTKFAEAKKIDEKQKPVSV
jgi:hypothetical protein